ncbi:hypothetical protein [Halostreptopolyspora alba]|uniref:Uncharacterized protein n=1 Tax=Halostreptopolyspora alba TaxID=2487137 RepID=A0A3N0EDW5_9ACTN|nr:hypothetical protein EFW17_05525 [Nocardiopsaceae bacterium YIM 96095]
MSNILTHFVRVHARPDRPIDRAEAEWILGLLVNTSGSYWVPVTAWRAGDGSRMEAQVGGMKNTDMSDLWFCHPDRYAAIWLRVCDEGGFDIVSRPDLWGGPYRECRYAFDEVRVTGSADRLPPIADGSAAPEVPLAAGECWEPCGEGVWRLRVEGTYRAGNSRTDLDVGPRAREAEWNPPRESAGRGGLVTPTTPSYREDDFEVLYPVELNTVTLDDRRPRVERVEYCWRGRVVHRAQEEYDGDTGRFRWEQRSADHWDNCADPDFRADSADLWGAP